MKRKLFIAAAIILFISCNQISAQFNAGILGGINTANLHAEQETTRQWSWGAGAVMEYCFSNNSAVRIEPMYLVKGGTIEGSTPNPRITVELNYFELPVLFKYDLNEPEEVYLIAGPSFGYLSSVDMGAEINNRIFKTDLNGLTERFDISAVLGGGINIDMPVGKMFLECKYTHGFTNIPKTGAFTAEWNGVELQGQLDKEQNKFRTYGFQFMLGYLIDL